MIVDGSEVPKRTTSPDGCCMKNKIFFGTLSYFARNMEDLSRSSRLSIEPRYDKELGYGYLLSVEEFKSKFISMAIKKLHIYTNVQSPLLE